MSTVLFTSPGGGLGDAVDLLSVFASDSFFAVAPGAHSLRLVERSGKVRDYDLAQNAAGVVLARQELAAAYVPLQLRHLVGSFDSAQRAHDYLRRLDSFPPKSVLRSFRNSARALGLYELVSENRTLNLYNSTSTSWMYRWVPPAYSYLEFPRSLRGFHVDIKIARVSAGSFNGLTEGLRAGVVRLGPGLGADIATSRTSVYPIKSWAWDYTTTPVQCWSQVQVFCPVDDGVQSVLEQAFTGAGNPVFGAVQLWLDDIDWLIGTETTDGPRITLNVWPVY